MRAAHSRAAFLVDRSGAPPSSGKNVFPYVLMQRHRRVYTGTEDFAVSTFDINIHEAIYSLSDALDLVGISHIRHGKRVAFIAAECGRQLGWEGRRLDDLFAAAILHDIGVAKTAVHARLAEFDWERDVGHAHVGAELLQSSSLLEHLATIVNNHHAHWSVLVKMDLDTQTRLSANCVFMADRIDVLSLSFQAEEQNLLLHREEITAAILEKRHDWFCDELVDAFVVVARSEAFWFSLESEQVDGYARTWLAETPSSKMDFCELRDIVHIFSHVVDAKSPFTRAHSDGVARLAAYLGGQFKLPRQTCEMLELAGLLHDIGKLRVPDEILDKPGRLTEAERARMLRHSFDTYGILKHIKGLEKIAEWAARHHERCDGTGYPFHLDRSGIAPEVRILSVADVFQALAQRRPYRDALDREHIMAILNEQVGEGKLDREVVLCVEQHLEECWRLAVGDGGELS
jgi:putative nucleotidyltransferase with HDIG domain